MNENVIAARRASRFLAGHRISCNCMVTFAHLSKKPMRFKFVCYGVALPLLTSLVQAQRGDTRGEGPQVPLPVAQKIEPAPPLSSAEQLKTFTLPPGFKIELVADESL